MKSRCAALHAMHRVVVSPSPSPQDITYANQFVKHGGLDLLMKIISDIHTAGQMDS